MIEVKWDVESHKRRPTLRIRGVATLDIGFETCCEALLAETNAHIREIRRSAGGTRPSDGSYRADWRQSFPTWTPPEFPQGVLPV